MGDPAPTSRHTRSIPPLVRAPAAICAGILLVGPLASCRFNPQVRPVIRGDVDPTGRAWPFAPTEARIYPLTRLDRDASGQPVIIVYLETVDRWGDFAKALGALELRVYASDRAISSSPETLELSWPGISMSNLEENAAWYDPASKMYRFTLGGLSRSGRVYDAAKALLDREASSPRQRLRVAASITAVGPDGREILLQDSYVIER